jgi:hypothetical protein
MGKKIYLIDDNETLRPLEESPYDSEDLLQKLLASYPDLLGGEGHGQWLLVERELAVPADEGGTGRWSLDHLFLDADGVPTLVEVKRSSDTRLRREVVGQMLDYAANGVAWWPLEQIQAAFERRCENDGLDAENELARLLKDDGAVDRFWQQVKTNLLAGKIRMVFVADVIPSELRRVVEFLNEQMDPAEVLAIEVPQYVGDGIRTLIPTVIGKTSEAERRKGTTPPRKILTLEQLLSQIADDGQRQAVEKLLRLVRSSGGIVSMGSSGISFRVQTKVKKPPVSIGWYFPPGVDGWYSIRELMLGFSEDSEEELKTILEPYSQRVANIAGAIRFPRQGLCGYLFKGEMIPSQIETFSREIGRVIQELALVRPVAPVK